MHGGAEVGAHRALGHHDALPSEARDSRLGAALAKIRRIEQFVRTALPAIFDAIYIVLGVLDGVFLHIATGVLDQSARRRRVEERSAGASEGDQGDLEIGGDSHDPILPLVRRASPMS
jgi:hypothetical protein